MKPEIPYDPLSRLNLGLSVTQALLSRDVVPLVFAEQFNGAGVYAIYYRGDFKAYEKITAANQDGFNSAIYVGKAVPKGSRKGIIGGAAAASTALYDRLREHSESVKAGKGLSVEEFWCRYLVVEDIWIPLAESLLINKYLPVWNQKLDGFGNHDPGSGRKDQKRSPWDVVHPGRRWAEKLKENTRTAKDLQAEVIAYLSNGDQEDEDEPAAG